MSIVLRQADALHHLKGRESLLRSYLLRLLGTDVSHVERSELCVKVRESKSTPSPLMIDYRRFSRFPAFLSMLDVIVSRNLVLRRDR